MEKQAKRIPKKVTSTRTGIEMQKILLSIPSSLFKRIEADSVKQGMSRTEVVKNLLNKYLPKSTGRQVKK